MGDGKKTQPGFMIYRETAAMLAMMDDAVAGQLIKACSKYFILGVEPDDLGGLTAIIWEKIKFDLDASRQKYDAICQRNLANIRKRYDTPTSGKPSESDTPTNGILTSNIKHQTSNTKHQTVNNIYSADKPRREKFVPPTDALAIAFFQEQGSTADEARAFVDFYQSKGWIVGRNPMKDWKASARNWMRRNRDAPKQKPKEKSFLDYARELNSQSNSQETTQDSTIYADWSEIE